jgi:transcriptional regulator with XRE-family HTH domain
MNYQEVMQRALNGRSVNAAAKEMGLPQQSLNRWVNGKNLPDYSSAAILAAEAHVSLGEMMRVLVEEDQRRKSSKDILSAGFRWLTNASNRLLARVSAA